MLSSHNMKCNWFYEWEDMNSVPALIGKNVYGEYFGTPFVGILNGSTRMVEDSIISYCVDLDQKIFVYGLERRGIEIWSNDEINNLFIKDMTQCQMI